MNQCENGISSLTSSSLLAPSKSYSSTNKPFSLFFYPKKASSLNNSSSLRLLKRVTCLQKEKSISAITSDSNNGAGFQNPQFGKRTDIKKIMILGAGPIVIGQACEFDYSGTQACKALKEEGYEVILINSNPATIMTDPDLADRTYIAPMTPELVEQVIEKERPDALLPTMGGPNGS